MLVNNFSSFPGKEHLIWISKWSQSRSLEGRGRQLRYKLPMGCVKPTTETEFSTIQHHYEPSGPTFEGLESPHSIDLVLGPLQELRESQWLCRDGELHPTNWTLVRNWFKKKKTFSNPEWLIYRAVPVTRSPLRILKLSSFLNEHKRKIQGIQRRHPRVTLKITESSVDKNKQF